MVNRLSFALLLKYFGIYGQFPRSLGDLDRGVIAALTKQLGSTVSIRNEAFELACWYATLRVPGFHLERNFCDGEVRRSLASLTW